MVAQTNTGQSGLGSFVLPKKSKEKGQKTQHAKQNERILKVNNQQQLEKSNVETAKFLYSQNKGTGFKPATSSEANLASANLKSSGLKSEEELKEESAKRENQTLPEGVLGQTEIPSFASMMPGSFYLGSMPKQAKNVQLKAGDHYELSPKVILSLDKSGNRYHLLSNGEKESIQADSVESIKELPNKSLQINFHTIDGLQVGQNVDESGNTTLSHNFSA